MNKSLIQELSPNKKYSIKLSLFGKDLFPNIATPQRSYSNPTTINNNSFISYSNIKLNEQKKNISKPSYEIQQDKIIDYINIESENDFFESSSESNKNSQSEESNKNNKFISPNFLSLNFYGFRGRSPYANPNLNNMIYYNFNSKIKMNTNPKTQNNINKNQKLNDNTVLITQLKDKILEYRCSVCNFIANEYQALHKHLFLNNHFTFPKKIKKGKKQTFFYESENKMNQTFIYSISKINDKNIVCKYCGKNFDSMFRLNYHLNLHKYKCEFCNALFNSKEELMEHNEIELLYNFSKTNIFNTNKDFKLPEKNMKFEIVDWEDFSSKEKSESDEEIKKNDFEQSYAFIEDNSENYDFNKMVKINDK